MRRDARTVAIASALLVTIVAVVERAHALATSGFFRDEASTWLFTTLDLHRMLGTIVAYDGNPPGYYAVAWLASRLAGRSEVALQIPSLVAGVALALACAGLTRSVVGRRAGTLAGLFVATNFFAVIESVDARAYAFAALGFALAAWLVWLVIRDGSTAPRVVALGAVIALTSYVHYTGALACGTLVAICAGSRSFRSARVGLATALALGAAAFAPWIPPYLIQREHGYRMFDDVGLSEFGTWLASEVLPLVGPPTIAATIVALIAIAQLKSWSGDAAARPLAHRFTFAMVACALAVVFVEPFLHVRGARYKFVIEPALALAFGASAEIALRWIDERIVASRGRLVATTGTVIAIIAILVYLGAGTFAAAAEPKSGVPPALLFLERCDARIVVLAPDYLAPTVFVHRALYGGSSRLTTYAFANDDRPQWQRFSAWLDTWNRPGVVRRFAEKMLRRAGAGPIYVLREPNASDRKNVRFASETRALQDAFVRSGRTRREIFERHGLYESAVVDVFTTPPSAATSCSCGVPRPRC
ncbi:MAG: hypothetical protein NVSMB21_12480 [Vulcanimicrobiaceae bacterium]